MQGCPTDKFNDEAVHDVGGPVETFREERLFSSHSSMPTATAITTGIRDGEWLSPAW